MAMTLSEIDSILDELESELPALMKDTVDPDDFWMAFAALVEALEDGVGKEDLPYVRQRIDKMLASRGLSPGK